MLKLKYYLLTFFIATFLQGCSGEGFHLRGNGKLPSIQESFYLEGINLQSPIGIALRDAFKLSGSQIVQDRSQATVLLQISSLVEDKVAAGYSRARKVREYDIFLRLNYSFRSIGKVEYYTPASSSVNLTRTQLYDSDFVLGKTEEEETIRQELRQNAARLILTKLRYSRKNIQTKKKTADSKEKPVKKALNE